VSLFTRDREMGGGGSSFRKKSKIYLTVTQPLVQEDFNKRTYIKHKL